MRVIIFLLLVVSFGFRVHAQAQNPNNRSENLPYYDQRAFHYGILIGVHSSIFKLNYSPAFTDPDFNNPDFNLDSLQSATPVNSAGFTLGGIVNFRLAEYLDIRLTPSVGFFEYSVDYNFTTRNKETQRVSATNVELPLLFKYKSQKRKNIRMYLIAGIKASFEASGNRDENENDEILRINGTSIAAEYGFGLDIYYPLFKFSPEIRFSQGLTNVLNPQENVFSTPISSLKVNTINFYLIFQ
ncbi:MAG: porin family protein [Bacteroidota bacterium]